LKLTENAARSAAENFKRALCFLQERKARENHKAAHAPICPTDRELPPIDLNLAPKIE
jgi:hypothetical protein